MKPLITTNFKEQSCWTNLNAKWDDSINFCEEALSFHKKKQINDWRNRETNLFFIINCKIKRRKWKPTAFIDSLLSPLNFQARKALENCDQFYRFSPLIPSLHSDLPKFHNNIRNLLGFQRANDWKSIIIILILW